jgi:predicted S18 family serine protease
MRKEDRADSLTAQNIVRHDFFSPISFSAALDNYSAKRRRAYNVFVQNSRGYEQAVKSICDSCRV